MARNKRGLDADVGFAFSEEEASPAEEEGFAFSEEEATPAEEDGFAFSGDEDEDEPLVNEDRLPLEPKSSCRVGHRPIPKKLRLAQKSMAIWATLLLKFWDSYFSAERPEPIFRDFVGIDSSCSGLMSEAWCTLVHPAKTFNKL